MSVAITIRDIPEETRDELAARAARLGQSMQQYLRRELIEIAGRDKTDDLLGRIVARNRSRPGVSRERIVEMIRQDRASH